MNFLLLFIYLFLPSLNPQLILSGEFSKISYEIVDESYMLEHPDLLDKLNTDSNYNHISSEGYTYLLINDIGSIILDSVINTENSIKVKYALRDNTKTYNQVIIRFEETNKKIDVEKNKLPSW